MLTAPINLSLTEFSTPSKDDIINHLKSLTPALSGGGDDDKKPKPKEFDYGTEMKQIYNRPLKYDGGRTSVDLIKQVAAKSGVNPSLLYSSAYVEGLNKAIAKPDEVSEDYNRAHIPNEFPIDGFYTYGLDTFGSNYDKLKKYLPEGFDQRFKTYDATNEKKEKIKTAAFRTNEDALLAKSAMLQDSMQSVSDYAKEKGIELDDKAKNYFTLAAYNGGFGNAKAMLDEYMSSKDKGKYFEGSTSKKQIHKNISSRMKLMDIANELLK